MLDPEDQFRPPTTPMADWALWIAVVLALAGLALYALTGGA